MRLGPRISQDYAKERLSTQLEATTSGRQNVGLGQVELQRNDWGWVRLAALKGFIELHL
jgi:hypothetical protein